MSSKSLSHFCWTTPLSVSAIEPPPSPHNCTPADIRSLTSHPGPQLPRLPAHFSPPTTSGNSPDHRAPPSTLCLPPPALAAGLPSSDSTHSPHSHSPTQTSTPSTLSPSTAHTNTHTPPRPSKAPSLDEPNHPLSLFCTQGTECPWRKLTPGDWYH